MENFIASYGIGKIIDWVFAGIQRWGNSRTELHYEGDVVDWRDAGKSNQWKREQNEI